jgi:hypothetical protein
MSQIKRTVVMLQVLECLPSNYKTLTLTPSTTHTKERLNLCNLAILLLG